MCSVQSWFLLAAAGTATAFAEAVPVNLLLLCGILGNVEDDDVERTLRAVPSLLAHGGTVLWTRHRGAPDLTPAIRGWLADVGVHEIAFVSQAPAAGWAVSAGVLNRSSTALGHQGRLFTFTRRLTPLQTQTPDPVADPLRTRVGLDIASGRSPGNSGGRRNDRLGVKQ